jgi:membrane protein CcdC involved in cytochrome C biogenesis
MRTLQKTYSLDVLLLCLLAIFIPLESEIKLFVVGIFCLCWFALRYKEKPHFKDWGHYDSLLLLCMIFPLTAVFSGFENMIWKSVLNQFAVVVVLLLLKHSDYTEQENSLVLSSMVIASAILMFVFHVAEGKYEFGLESLHLEQSVNHYFLVCYSIALTFVLTLRQKTAKASNAMLLIVMALLLITLLMSKNFFLWSAVALISLLLWLISNKKLGTYYYFILIPVLLLLNVFMPDQSSENKQNTCDENLIEKAFDDWMEHPVIGMGIGQYQRAESEKVYEKHKENNENVICKKEDLYFKTLVEQGLIGFILICALIFYLLMRLIMSHPLEGDPAFYWASWLAASTSFQLFVIFGFVEYTLNSNLGLLTMLLVGLCFTYQKTFERE